MESRTSTEKTNAQYFDANRAWWDAVVPVHEASRGYNREGFLRGEKPLCPVELAELGPHVAGKRLLHLQCHFGMDTLNWGRLGTTVTGRDFSAPAIAAARRLSADSGVPGRFAVVAQLRKARRRITGGGGTTGADGRYRSNRLWKLPDAQRDLAPLMYSLQARKSYIP